MRRFLTGLYPSWWRARYGREFDALLEDTAITWRDVLDVAVGALRMHLSKGKYDLMENRTALRRVIELNLREIPNGYETEAVVEHTRADGDTMVIRQLWRELDFGECYVTLNHVTSEANGAKTFIITGRKGEVVADFRTDRTEMLVLESDGTVRRTEQTVKTSMKYEAIRKEFREKYRRGLEAGLSPDEAYRSVWPARPE